MTDMIMIVCTHCDAVNRIPIAKSGDNPVCGKCRSPLFEEKPAELTSRNFLKHISRNSIPVVVDFRADWCGPCKMMAPVFKKAAEKLEPTIRFAKINTEKEAVIASQYSVRSIPTIVIFEAGKEVARRSGALQLPELTSWIKSITKG